MRRIQYKPAVETVQVRCPMDNTIHEAVARFRYDDSVHARGIECHKSQECQF